jgi:prepilin-type processing-associated H-X9-DG protein
MILDMNPEMDETNYWTGVTGGMKHFAMPRHGNGAKSGINVLFFDLSARHTRIKQLWNLKWHRDFDTSGYTNNGGTWPEWMNKYEDP